MRKFGFVIIFLFLFIGNVGAEEKPLVKVYKEENASNVILKVFAKNISNVYAGSLTFSYDPKMVEVISVGGGTIVKNIEGNILELGGDVQPNSSTASYQFTHTGRQEGFTGSGELFAIHVKPITSKTYKIGRMSNRDFY